ncbi:hypothetical protein MRX96_005153 [Rhipicephalus microplus]
MATGGMQAAIEPFSGKNWSSWIQRLSFYFVLNDVCDEQKKRALLLTLCGADSWRATRPAAGRVDQKLCCRPQKLSDDCNFGVLATTPATSTPPAEGYAAVLTNPNMLPQDVMLSDRFECGIRDDHLQ